MDFEAITYHLFEKLGKGLFVLITKLSQKLLPSFKWVDQKKKKIKIFLFGYHPNQKKEPLPKVEMPQFKFSIDHRLYLLLGLVFLILCLIFWPPFQSVQGNALNISSVFSRKVQKTPYQASEISILSLPKENAKEDPKDEKPLKTAKEKKKESFDQQIKDYDKLLKQVAKSSKSTPNMTPPKDGRPYEIKSGDTLFNIAMAEGTTVEEIMAYNHMTSSTSLHPGDIIYLKIKQ